MGFMDRFSGAHPEQIQAAVQKAQDAWDAGSLAYVQKSKTMASLDGDAATAMVDGILRIGWASLRGAGLQPDRPQHRGSNVYLRSSRRCLIA